MAATITTLVFSNPSSPTLNYQPKHHQPMSIFLLLTLFLLSISILILSFYTRIKKPGSDPVVKCSISSNVHKDPSPTHLTHSLLLEILPDDPVENGSGSDGKKKKRRRKKKRQNLKGEDGSGLKEELVCLYPFTSSSSATQRKIKQQYDQLVKSHDSNGLTLAQVGQFVNCLIEARNDLQHKSEVIQRKFTITKALLFKADRSSFDRLRQQIYKLELEQKRLEEDAFVYNWLQQELKLSPAYKKMLEIAASMELKAKSGELVENTETDFADISFEELLAQEKKDSFWQRNGKPRSCVG